MHRALEAASGRAASHALLPAGLRFDELGEILVRRSDSLRGHTQGVTWLARFVLVKQLQRSDISVAIMVDCMHPQTVFTKTPKAVHELKNKTIRLPRDLGVLFLAIDGKSPISELPQMTGIDEASLPRALNRLMAYGYIRIVWKPAEVAQSSPVSDDIDLDFTRPFAIAQH